MTSDTRARLRAEVDRTLSLDEARAYLATPIDDVERQQTIELVEWFRRRYATPLERLRYVTNAYKRWTRTARRGAPDSSL